MIVRRTCRLSGAVCFTKGTVALDGGGIDVDGVGGARQEASQDVVGVLGDGGDNESIRGTPGKGIVGDDAVGCGWRVPFRHHRLRCRTGHYPHILWWVTGHCNGTKKGLQVDGNFTFHFLSRFSSTVQLHRLNFLVFPPQ